MRTIRRPRRVLGLGIAALVAGATCAGATQAASPTGHGAPSSPARHHGERLVVRGDATVVDAPCHGDVCTLELADGSFRGTPVGSGAYEGRVELKVAELFPNGERGVCAPLRSRIVLGAGSPDRLVLAVSGDSCQDGAGPVTATSFTGLARFTVKYGTGTYAGATGHGLASFLEDAADHDRMTLIGRVYR
jgi:hypothetical protein